MNGDTMKKYKLIESDKTTPNGKPLFQLVALRDFGSVSKGDKGGYVESEDNLSHKGNCWVFDDAWVFGKAWVFGNAQIFDDAWVSGNAKIFDDAKIFDGAWVFGNAQISGSARIFDNAQISGDAQVYDTTEFTDRLVSPAQTDTCTHKKRNICLCDWGDDCPMNSEPDFTYCPKCGVKL